MTSFDSIGFVLDDGLPVDESALLCNGVVGPDLPSTEPFFPPNTVMKFSIGLLTMPRDTIRTRSKSIADGDKRPTIRDDRPCRFLSQPTSEHLKKMLDSKGL